MAQQAQDDWVFRVLGVAARNIGAPTAKVPAGKLTPIWIDAKERVDQGFERLQSALRGVDDPDLQQIADYGLNGVTKRETVALVSALMDADGGRGTDKLVVAIDRFRNFMDGSVIVDLIEDNPFGVDVPLRAELGSALDAIAAKIAA